MTAKRVNGQKIGMFVVYRSLSPEGPWEPIKADSVPDWIRHDADIMGELAQGCLVQSPQDDPSYAYRATKTGLSK